MGNTHMCRSVLRVLLAVGLFMQSSPLAFAQVEGGWEAVDTLVEQTIPAGELHDIAADLVEQCQVHEDVAQSVELEAQAIIEASEATEQVLTNVASDPNAIVTMLQAQGVTVPPEVVATLTEAAKATAEGLAGKTLADVEPQLAALKEAFDTFARSTGLDAETLEKMFAAGPPGAESEGHFREMAFLAECVNDPMRAYFEAEMEQHAAGGMGMPPRELLEQMMVSGYNPGEIMSEVAREMAMYGGAPSEAMVAEGRAHMEQMLNDPNISEAHRAEMATMFEAWQSGNFEMMQTASFEHMMPSGFEAFVPTGSMETAYVGGTTETHYGTMTTTETYVNETTTQASGLVQDSQNFLDTHSPGSGTAHTLIAEHNEPGHQEGHWDGNSDGIADHTHPLGTMAH